MNNNKTVKPKRKNIKKQLQKPTKSNKSNKQFFSFQDQMIDLISDSESVQASRIQEEQIDAQPERLDVQDNLRAFKLSCGGYLMPVNIGKCYKVVLSHEQQGKAQINAIFEAESLEINGKKVSEITAYHTFVFKIKGIQKRTLQTLCLKQIKGDQPSLQQFIKDINLDQETLVRTNMALKMIQCIAPWQKLPECINGNKSLMILGQKNTGKSTLAQYMLNSKGQDCVLLDCDIGRNSQMEGCVSLSSLGHCKMIWIGQLSPLNNLQTYLRGIRYLFNYYRDRLFTRKLIVNTMGYTTGLGELLIYQIYQIIQPQQILVLQSDPSPSTDSLSSILTNLKSGQYTHKLYLNSSIETIHPSSSSFYSYNNCHASSKKTSCRFEKYFESVSSKPIKNICDLLQLIRQSNSLLHYPYKLQRLARKEVKIYEQGKHAKEEMEGVETVSYRQVENDENVDMRLVVLGKMVKDKQTLGDNIISQFQSKVQGLFEASVLGFCFEGYIYAPVPISGLMGVLSEGIDFQKKFYHLNEKQMIDLQLRMGRVKYLIVTTKGLGSKGVRNNPSKMV